MAILAGPFTVALLIFALAAALAVNALTGPANAPTAWDFRARLIATVLLSSFGLALGYGWLASEQAFTKGWSAPTLYGLCLAGGAAPAAVLIIPGYAGAIAPAVVLFTEAWCWWKFLPMENRLPGLMAVLALIIGAGAAWAVLNGNDRWRLAIAALSVALFEMPRLLSATFRTAPGAQAQRP